MSQQRMERQQEQVKKKGKEEKQTEEISTRCSIINRKGHSGKIEREFPVNLANILPCPLSTCPSACVRWCVC